MTDATFRAGLYIQRTDGIEAYWQWLQVKAIEHKFSGGKDNESIDNNGTSERAQSRK